MERKEIITYIRHNKPSYQEINFSWHSDEELMKIKEIVDTEMKLCVLESELKQMRTETRTTQAFEFQAC